MVKFAKYLNVHLVPEWRPAYCNYKKLKKDLKKIKNQLGTGCRRQNSLLRVYNSQSNKVISVHHKSSDLFGSRLDLVETEFLEPLNAAQAHNEKQFFARLDSELNKVNEFYKGKEKEFMRHAEILDMQMQTLLELNDAAEKKAADPLAESKNDSEERKPLLTRQSSIDVMDSVPLTTEMLFQTVSNHRSMANIPEKDQLSTLLSSQLGDIEARSSPDCGYDFNSRRNAPASLSTHPPGLIINALQHATNEDVMHKVKNTAKDVMDQAEDVASFIAKIRQSERMLRDAFIEFYRGLGLLKSYSMLNTLAFTKILKKYDKVTERGAYSTYMRTVDNSYFHTSDRVNSLIAWVESMFADHFANGDRHRARKSLRPRQAKSPHRITFFLGLFSGCSLALVVAYIAVLHVLFQSLTPEEQASRIASYMQSVFPIFSMTALLILHMYMYGWNLYLWRRTRINYAFIFEFAPGTELCYRKVLLVCTGLTVVLGVGLLGHITAQLNESPAVDLIPLGVVLTLLILLFCPLNICFRSSRLFFLNCMFRIICSPYYEVLLADFFLGDQLCSQVPVLRNIEYVMCYYLGGHFLTENGDICLNNARFKEISYIISVLPYWWRLMQCVRRYRDEGSKSHIANGGKYLSAMLAVIIRTFYGRNETMFWTVSYIAASTFATFYQIYWDLVIDWGLLRKKSTNKWLRDNLILEDHHYIYFISMGVNILLRFPWVLSVTHFQFGGLDPHFTDFLLAALEIVRRGHWNFYRLENEHLNNVGHYRAVKTVPLPFDHKESGRDHQRVSVCGSKLCRCVDKSGFKQPSCNLELLKLERRMA
ncbi:xenotropic and polytropic retrovirus receptor 1 [Marchantia polymorpha subsp. ruderalis]|uniref:Uncharacterized protein n=2 Tax=Marchantia polymorpha TaxID=3197 RepID=A0AAF6C1A8_MARPO|nr:hypothetical protein MARPO_0067s0070 [Marchantia polymorpha]BBN18042.1 hypothetical protein Mp_7g19080 [Marchantia polymorpha subsp. ruderalis]|eukprot:PTQ35992.1 hypothetical protein MARPO_0067s0070 [Marchantia polymorpha]